MTGAIVLFGAGSSLVAEYEETCRRLEATIVAVVRNRPGISWASADIAVVEHDALSTAILSVPCVCPFFTPANRRIAAAEASAAGFTFAAALIDPTAIVASSSSFDAGGFVNAGCIVGAATRAGEHVVLNRGASIGHHVAIGDFASIGPGATVCGHVTIESDALVGAGAVVLPKVRIGAAAVVAAGAVVVDDVAPGTRVFGAAAKPRAPER